MKTNQRFTYDDTVRVSYSAPPEMRPGSKAFVVGVFDADSAPKYRRFEEGVVYTIEFEDGAAIDVEERYLEAALN